MIVSAIDVSRGSCVIDGTDSPESRNRGHFITQRRLSIFRVQGCRRRRLCCLFESNAGGSRKVPNATDWEWSGLKSTAHSSPAVLLHYGPVLKPTHWTRHVNRIETEAELKSLYHSLARGTPFGDTHSQTKIASMRRLESSLRPRGRRGHREEQHVPFTTA